MLDPLSIADKVVEAATGKGLIGHGKDLVTNAGEAVSGAVSDAASGASNNNGGGNDMGGRLDSVVGAVTGTGRGGRGSDKIASVIKYEGNNETMIWKHPTEDFNTGSQLIVHASQEAIFYMNGESLDLFGAGRHTLETQNLPLVRKLFKAPTGGRTPFHCEVYFINKTEKLDIKWGTDRPMTYREPEYRLPIQFGASGNMSMRVENSRMLLEKIVGTEKGITHTDFKQRMRGLLLMNVRTLLVDYFEKEKVDIFNVDRHLENVATALREQLVPKFADYGVAIEQYNVTGIVGHEDENFRKLGELQSANASIAQDQINVNRELTQYEATAGKRERDIEVNAKEVERMGAAEGERLRQMGITRQEEMQLEAVNTMAGNEAIGQMTNTGIGLGMMTGVGFGVGGAVGGMVSNAMGDALNPQQGTPQVQPGAAAQQTQPQQSGAVALCACGAQIPANAKFCLECGKPAVSDNEMICSSCGVKTPKGKFCFECGTSMTKKCPQCNTEMPSGGKFCQECGQKAE